MKAAAGKQQQESKHLVKLMCWWDHLLPASPHPAETTEHVPAPSSVVEHDALPKQVCANGMCRRFPSSLLQQPAQISVPPPSAPSVALAGATRGRSACGGVVAHLQRPCSSSPRYCLGTSSLHPASMDGPGAGLALEESPGGPLAWLHHTKQVVRALLNRLKVFFRSCPRNESVWKGLGTPGLQPQGGLGGAAIQEEGLGQRPGEATPGQIGGEGRQESKGGRKRRGRKLIGKHSMKTGEKKDGMGDWGEERHREFCNSINSFQTMSKEPWQHGLKQILPLIL